MLESLVQLLMGGDGPHELLKIAELQLATGRAALVNAPDLDKQAVTLFAARIKMNRGTADPTDVLKKFDLTTVFGRMALAVACLPEQLRDAVLHNVFKSLCIWVGASDTWQEKTPGAIMLASRERLRCADSSAAVLTQVHDTLVATCPADKQEAMLAEYVDALAAYLTETFGEAQEQLDGMREQLAAIDAEPRMTTMRDVLERLNDAEAQEVHPHAGKTANLRDDFRHPAKHLSTAAVKIIDWETRVECNTDDDEDARDDMFEDYNGRAGLYGLPHDEKLVLVQVTDGDYAGVIMIVHDSELTY